ncbi:MAG TPA: FHA domain-containing serine/threonine-protein kinase [Ktedonosporobacter sp.]|nr:FHA domain-containing serine/threonine-protein kinase [Ktedonosporobacter sp.]
MSQRDVRSIGGVYRVGQLLTTSGKLTTYTAYDRNTNDVVGLFVIEVPPAMSVAQQWLQSLEKRRSIQSPHLIRVHNWGLEGQRFFIATDPLRGKTLQYVLDNEDIDFERALYISQQLAQGLKALHDQGISGMDLRPQLITIDTIGISDRVQIDDIGLRSLIKDFGYMNSQGVQDISYLDPRYVAPEYINNGQIGPWSDIYQVGILLFTMITGRLPFVGHNPAETGIMQTNDPVPRMSQFKHGTPDMLQGIVERAMAKDPTQRFANASALIKALEEAQIPAHPLPAEREKAPSSSVGLTREMTAVDYDVAMQATHINGLAPDQSDDEETIRAPAPIEAGVYAYLLYEQPNTAPQRIPIKERNVIVGRVDPKRGVSPDIDLSEIDPKMTISRQHARIRFEETFFYIEDLKSRNKTRLGELPLKPLQAEMVQHGDVLYFGSVRMRFEVPGRGRLPPLKEKRV